MNNKMAIEKYKLWNSLEFIKIIASIRVYLRCNQVGYPKTKDILL